MPIKAGLYQESIKVFRAMKSMGISRSIVTFNRLFSILLQRGRTNMAKEMFDEMLRYMVLNQILTLATFLQETSERNRW